MGNYDEKWIEERLGYTFRNKNLLRHAFVHSSYAHEENIGDNDRMEFFGDAILEFVVSEYLFEKHPDYDEGKLSKMRAAVVSADGLRPIVDGLGILDCLLVAGNSVNIRTLSKKIEANLYEAVLCAIYLDGGFDEAKKFIMRTLKKAMDNVAHGLKTDYKSMVQEYCQQRHWNVSYKQDARSGPDNTPRFIFSLWINGKRVSEGSGTSIKKAEQDAAAKIVKEWRID